MKFKYLFSNMAETSDDADDKLIMTHYYDNNYESTKNALLEVAKSARHRVMDINDEYKEFLISYPKGELIVTLYSKTYNITSVDFKVSTNYLFSFGRGVKMIDNYYDALNKKLSLKKIGGINGQ
jgi:hypothetical protein